MLSLAYILEKKKNWLIFQQPKYKFKETMAIDKLAQIKCLKGIPEVEQGANVVISLYQDKITVNNYLIPLKRIKVVETSQIYEFRSNIITQKIVGQTLLHIYMNKTFFFLYGCLKSLIDYFIAHKLFFLRIEYNDLVGVPCTCLFVANDNYVNKFAKLIKAKQRLGE